jgi:hypothetical protein
MIRHAVPLWLLGLLVAPAARAQDDSPRTGGGPATPPPPTAPTHVYLPPPGYPQPGTDPNAGLPSSSRPTTNAASASDGFDLDRGSQRTGVVTGAKGSEGSVTLSRRPVQAPAIHTVRKGDTLWDLCARYYDNPYNWPKIWSYNPQIQNPHWIYPGDELRMRGGGAVAGLGGAGGPGGSGGGDDGGRGDGSDRDGFGDAPGTAPGDTARVRTKCSSARATTSTC